MKGTSTKFTLCQSSTSSTHSNPRLEISNMWAMCPGPRCSSDALNPRHSSRAVLSGSFVVADNCYANCMENATACSSIATFTSNDDHFRRLLDGGHRCTSVDARGGPLGCVQRQARTSYLLHCDVLLQLADELIAHELTLVGMDKRQFMRDSPRELPEK